MKLFLTIFLCFLFITTCSEACNSGMSIIDSQCFNEILYLDQENKYYRAGHFAMNTKGDMIIEYSYLQYRLFYGLKNNGKLFFQEVTKEIELQNDDNHHNVNPEYDDIDWEIKNPKEKIATIHALAVAPDKQGTKVSYSFLKDIEDHCRKNGNIAVHLDVIDTNIPAYKLYIRNGYTEVACIKMYYEVVGTREFWMMEHVL